VHAACNGAYRSLACEIVVAAADAWTMSRAVRNVSPRWVLLVLPIVLAATACGPGDSGGEIAVVDDRGAAVGEPSGSLLRHAVTATEAETTARASVVVSFAIADLDLTIESVGVIDLATGDAHDHIAFGEGTYLRGFPELGGLDLEVIRVDGYMYVRVPEGWTGTTDAEWFRAEAGPSFGGAPASDPREFLQLLGDVVGPVEQVGTEIVDDVTTTRYDATVDATTSPDGDGSDSPVADEHEVLGDASVWIDGEARIRRLTCVVETPGPLTIRVDAEFSDFGTPLDAEPPTDWVDWADVSASPDGPDPGGDEPD
jgi:hypothetical protein